MQRLLRPSCRVSPGSLPRESLCQEASSPGVGSALAAFAALLAVACSDGDGDGASALSGSPEETASSCESAAQCFAGLEVEGEPLCLERVRGGHCTHLCDSDADCCAVPGECDTELSQVCSPFESTGQMMCFLSCEGENLERSEYDDEAEYCQRLVGPDFICRSSGGGANNRKICLPGECDLGASCVVDDDCASGLECLADLPGGYCGVRGCESALDCPGDAACVRRGDVAICARPCSKGSDCSFCRHGVFAECRSGLDFVGDEGSGSYCLPVAD